MKKLIFILLAALSVVCTSCLEFVEEITVNKDGSGNYTMKMDFNKAIDMMMGFAPDSIKETLTREAMMDTMMAGANENGEFDQMFGNVETLEGITNFSKTLEDGMLVFSFDYANMEAMNAAQMKMGEDQKEDGTMKPSNYAFKKGQLMREYNVDLGEAGMDDETMQMMEMMMGDSQYKVVYYLPGKVKKTNLKEASIEGNSVVQNLKLLDVMKESSLLDGKIKFK